MSVFDFDDYKIYVREWIKSQPKQGYGQLNRIAKHLNIHSVVVSQIFSGDRDLTLEQACSLGNYLGLSNMEKDYLLLLVQLSRSSSLELSAVLQRQLNKLKKEATNLHKRIKHEKFSDVAKSTFYSKWYYSAVRLSTDITNQNSIDSIAQKLGLDKSIVAEVLDFLIQNKLVIKEKNQLNVGPQVTHLPANSPLISKHHSNWRLKALQAMDQICEDDLFYTGPMALSKEDAKKIQSKLISLIKENTEIVKQSDSEALFCLGIDWFRFDRNS